MANVLRMPEVLANVTEALLAEWIVKPGDAFSIGDVLAEIETEKAQVELLAEQDGVLGRTLIAPGDAVDVGTPIAVLIIEGETDDDIDRAIATVDLSKAAVGRSSSDATTPSEPAILDVLAEKETVPTGSSLLDEGRLFSSPLSRRLARDGGVDLSTISGTGPNGRIVRRDVELALASQQDSARERVGRDPAAGAIENGKSAGVSTHSTARYQALPHTPMRRAIARRLSESKATVPHFYLSASCLVDELLELRKRINEASPSRVSVNDLVVKAVGRAFVEVPEANVTWSDEELRLWDRVDIGIAIATESGLVTPVIRNVDQISLLEVAAATADLAERARSRSLKQNELEGGNVSVTNLGMFGTEEFSAILNPPQSAILAVGAAQPTPVVVDGSLTVGTTMRCTLSVDHRAIDGALGARWLSAFKSIVENPVSILL